MIDVKKAIQSAADFLVNANESTGEKPASIRLEEVELGSWTLPDKFDEAIWRVVLSYIPSNDPHEEIMRLSGSPTRVFREFHVQAESGKILRMKRFEVAA